MISHTIETCPDDLNALRERLDELAAGGARIVSVLWQPQRVETDQSAAYEASGSFVIVLQSEFPDPLRARDDVDRPHDLGSTPLA